MFDQAPFPRTGFLLRAQVLLKFRQLLLRSLCLTLTLWLLNI